MTDDEKFLGIKKPELTELVRQILAEIPTSLPANGGNADTVDGYHVDGSIHMDGSIPPKYFTEFLRIDDDTKSIERWETGNLKVAFADYATNGGNADTVDGLHANDFTQIIDFGYTETDTKTAIGQSGKTTIYRCTNWTDYPAEFIDGQGTLIAINYNGSGTVGTDWVWCTQIIINPRPGNRIYVRYADTTYVSEWKEISTTPIKSTGWITTPTNDHGDINLPEGDSRKYLSVCSASSLAFLYHTGSTYIAHIKDGNMAVVQSTPVTYIAFYID